MTSVVIAAHNEAAVLGRCLEALSGGPSRPSVVVVANGCSDDTAAVAARYSVQVVELAEAGKAAALNAGDGVAIGFPRIYLDADIELVEGSVDDLTAVLRPVGPAWAAVPRRRLDLRGRPMAVRAYFAINERLPAFRHGLFGRGMIALSEEGRRRFDRFPLLVADDLFIDSMFSDEEKRSVSSVTVRVATPRRTVDLVRRLVRVRRGNAVMRQAASNGSIGASVRPARRFAWLTEVVLPRPWLLPAAVVYVVITVYAAARAHLDKSSEDWARDESSREPSVGDHG